MSRAQSLAFQSRGAHQRLKNRTQANIARQKAITHAKKCSNVVRGQKGQVT